MCQVNKIIVCSGPKIVFRGWLLLVTVFGVVSGYVFFNKIAGFLKVKYLSIIL